jgi:hypothetical protein
MRPEHAIDQRITELRDALMRTGTVTGTAASQVVVAVDGAELALPYLDSYTPTVGDVVHILTARPGAWLVLGTTHT